MLFVYGNLCVICFGWEVLILFLGKIELMEIGDRNMGIVLATENILFFIGINDLYYIGWSYIFYGCVWVFNLSEL